MNRLACALIALLAFAGAPAAPKDTAASIYDLEVELSDQTGMPHGLDVYRGQPVLISMFYGSCPMTCPILIDTIRAVENSVPEDRRHELRVLMISIDPDHDTTQSLDKLARERRLDTSRWSLSRTDAKSVRKIAALLDIQYRPLPTGGYNHSSIVTVLSPSGEIVAQSSQLGKADETLTAALVEMTSRGGRRAAAGQGR